MLSFGIRFGLGFDRTNILKVMQSVPEEYNYDFLVLGSSPGGVACALEASAAGKKTAIVKWRRFTPAEEEGFDEDLAEMADVLNVSDRESLSSARPSYVEKPSEATLFSHQKMKRKKSSFVKSQSNFSKVALVAKIHRNSTRVRERSRKVRQSRLDLSNELFKRGQQARKLMHNAASLQEAVDDAHNSGWRVYVSSKNLTFNWNKMADLVMDYTMKENWKLMKTVAEEGVEIIEGWPAFVDNHVLKIFKADADEIEISADIICIAPSADYVIPDNIARAEDFGINIDDFTRMNESPGKILIIGDRPEGLECAGIVASCRHPVTVISRFETMRGYDAEIRHMIVEDLKNRGVKFLENTEVSNIDKTVDGRLLVKFSASKSSQHQTLQEDVFDTVLFSVGTVLIVDFMNLSAAGVEYDPELQKIRTDENDCTIVSNIYAIGDVVAQRPSSYDISELAGKLLGKRLFRDSTEIMDYTMIPTVIYTPIEYAFIGISEEAAVYRLGEKCLQVYYEKFAPLEFIVPPKSGQCFAKIIVYTTTDLIIGLHLFGPGVGEIVQGFSAALKAGMTIKQLQSTIGVQGTKAREIVNMKKTRRSVFFSPAMVNSAIKNQT